jgi:hypothetical protein
MKAPACSSLPAKTPACQQPHLQPGQPALHQLQLALQGGNECSHLLGHLRLLCAHVRWLQLQDGLKACRAGQCREGGVGRACWDVGM